jgi:hypothetical protein
MTFTFTTKTTVCIRLSIDRLYTTAIFSMARALIAFSADVCFSDLLFALLRSALTSPRLQRRKRTPVISSVVVVVFVVCVLIGCKTEETEERHRCEEIRSCRTDDRITIAL